MDRNIDREGRSRIGNGLEDREKASVEGKEGTGTLNPECHDDENACTPQIHALYLRIRLVADRHEAHISFNDIAGIVVLKRSTRWCVRIAVAETAQKLLSLCPPA
eukprot:1303365-Amorphochlora_amoeboformis.AAC.3